MCTNALLWAVLALQCCFSGLTDADTYRVLTELCPARTFCHTNATTVIPSTEHESCCQSCSCEDDCFITGNCCPDFDIPVNVEALPPVTPCTDIDNIVNDGRDLSKRSSSYLSFRFVTTCPTAVDANDEIVQLCKQPRRLNDYIPVSTLNGNRLYRNEHCARCNGESDFVFWNLYVDNCPELYTEELTDIEARDRVILEKCVLTAKPTAYRFVQSTLCPWQSFVRSKCNATRQWSSYDADIQKACETDTPRINSIYRYAGKGTSLAVYANIYCFLCNHDSVDYPEDKCVNFDTTPQRQPWANPFTILLEHSGRSVASAEAAERHQLCPGKGQIFDKYTKVCRQLLCGFGMMPTNGICQPLGEMHGMPVRLFFEIHADTITDEHWLMVEAEIVIALFDSWFERSMLHGDLLPNCAVERCDTNLHLLDNGALYFSAGIYTQRTCQVHILLEDVKQMVNTWYFLDMSNSTDTSGARNMTISLDIASEVDARSNTVTIASVLSRPCERNPVYPRLEMLETCPRLRLTEVELRKSTQLSNASIWALMGARISPNTTLDTDTVFTLCLSTYTSIMEASTNAANGDLKHRMLWVASSMAVMVASLKIHVHGL